MRQRIKIIDFRNTVTISDILITFKCTYFNVRNVGNMIEKDPYVFDINKTLYKLSSFSCRKKIRVKTELLQVNEQFAHVSDML